MIGSYGQAYGFHIHMRRFLEFAKILIANGRFAARAGEGRSALNAQGASTQSTAWLPVRHRL